MLNNINLNLLRSLHVLLDECHVSRTAERLNLTQSAVSRQLSQLRDLFADPLLVRDGNQLYLTPKAQELKRKLNDLFSEFEHLLEDKSFEPERWQGEVSFACSDYVAQYIFPELVEKISLIAPKASFEYHLWQPKLLDHLGNSPIKLASTLQSERPVGVSGWLIGEDDLVCVMRDSHPLAGKESITLEDLLSYQHIVITGGGDKDSEFDCSLRAQGLKKRVGLKVPFFSAAFNTLIKTDFLLVTPKHIARNMKQHLPIVNHALPLDIPAQKYWLIWHAKYDQDPAHKWIRTQALGVLQESMYSVGYNYKS